MSCRSKDVRYMVFRSPEAATIADQWRQTLEAAVLWAGAKTLNTSSALGKREGYIWAYHKNLLRMNSDNEKESSAAKTREAMLLGHAIEVYLTPDFLADLYKKKFGVAVKCWNHVRGGRCVASGNPGDFLVQRSRERPPLFPINFKGASAQPDIRIGLGGEMEAVFDFTTPKQAGHLLDKGGHVVGADGRIAYACEILTPPWSRRDPVMAKALHELDRKINLDPRDISGS